MEGASGNMLNKMAWRTLALENWVKGSSSLVILSCCSWGKVLTGQMEIWRSCSASGHRKPDVNMQKMMMDKWINRWMDRWISVLESSFLKGPRSFVRIPPDGCFTIVVPITSIVTQRAWDQNHLKDHSVGELSKQCVYLRGRGGLWHGVAFFRWLLLL